MTTLPIRQSLPPLRAALASGNAAVLVAPPGAGKTTEVAPALLNEPWCTGRILLLSPRRLAARAAAEHMAAQRDESVGATIGYATRMDSRQSRDTRVLVLTEGIFIAMIEADPELAGVSAVLFDEVHERSLDSDFSLALALDAQHALRPDLRLVAMSATLDGARFAALMDDCPVIESQGRRHPLTLRHIGRSAGQRIEDAMAAAIRLALTEAPGGLLAFLPGMAEIERTAERLYALPSNVDIHRLHGAIDPAAQRAAIAPAQSGRRKLVLSSPIAESSLTIDGVRIVVDSGLVRRPRYDRTAGLTRLATERVSRAAADQRAGRAARQAPGVAYRLWEEAANAGLHPFDPPEILEADLSALMLSAALWGVSDPRALRWIDPPSEAAISAARARLQVLGAIDAAARPTPHGAAIARLPMDPRLAHMLIAAAHHGLADKAAHGAVLIGERGLGGDMVDLDARLQRWRADKGPRAQAARRLATRWRQMVSTDTGDAEPSEDALGICIAIAFPDRVARRRGQDGGTWISVGGRGFTLDPLSPLTQSEWLAVSDVQGSAASARIVSAATISRAAVERLFADRITQGTETRFDPGTGRVHSDQGRWLGAIRLSGNPQMPVDRATLSAVLIDGVRAHGLHLLPWGPDAMALRARIGFARQTDPSLPDLSDAGLCNVLEHWLAPLVDGKTALQQITPEALSAALAALLSWEQTRRLDALAPAWFTSAAGSRHPIDYCADGGPSVTIRVQALFGTTRHPMAGATPLLLNLTSPAGRPIQTTRDLPGFWAGSWRAVAREMRGRYPKHPWPDDPAAAVPTLRTKKADARR